MTDPVATSRWDDVDLHSSDDDDMVTYRYHGEYRRTAPQYVAGRGLVRYSSALRHLIPVRIQMKKKTQETLGVDEAGLLSFITFNWLTKYMIRAYKKGFTLEDIPEVPPLDSCDYNAQRLELMWQQEMAVMGPRAASLKRVVWRFIRTRLLLSVIILSLNIIASFISVAFVMRWLLEFAENPDAPTSEGLTWAVCLGFSEVLRLVFYATAWSISCRTGLRLRAACLTMLYRKIIRVHSLGDKSIGELVNMFASDGQRLFQMVVFGPMIISGPLCMTFGTLYILWLLSPWALLGMLVFIVFYPIQYGMSRLVGKYQAKAVATADKRISLTSEILTSIKLIKMYAWEKSFTNTLFDLREKELFFLQKAMYFQSLTVSVASTIPIVTAIVMFLAHVGMGYQLTPSKAFSAICFCMAQLSTVMIFTSESWKVLIQGGITLKRIQAFTIVSICLKQLRNVLTHTREGWKRIFEAGIAIGRFQAFATLALLVAVFVPSWQALIEACRSVRSGAEPLHRIKSVMLLNEVGPFIAKPIDKAQAVCISNGTFGWDSPPPQPNSKGSKKTNDKLSNDKKKKAENVSAQTEETTGANPQTNLQPVLQDINFFVPKGNLVGVCGQVGAGKSSLLVAALGQLRMDSGKVSREGSCAYVSQQAWILNATLKENILFGEAFNAKRYHAAIHSCALNEDIKTLPGEDETEIGERGINLSGGQKQRVALARALYSNRNIYFLDDPLSAVDAHVGAHIFNEYILKALKFKSVVFVTHQIQYLNQCDEICVMKEGRIVERGTHDRLLTSEGGGEYAAMVRVWQHSQSSGAAMSADGNSDSGLSGMNGNCVGNEKVIVNGTNKEKTAANGSTPTAAQVAEGKQLTQAEQIEHGSLQRATYLSYVRAAGGLCVICVVVGIILVNIGTSAFSSWWLAQWINADTVDIVKNMSLVIDNETVYENVTIVGTMDSHPDFEMYRTVYALTIIGILCTNLVRGLIFAKVSLRASRSVHSLLFHKVIKTPMQFFETTPLGRIQNLFSKDLDEVDVHLPFTLECMLEDAATLIFAVFFICLVFPWFIVPLAIISVVFISLSRIFRVAVRDLKRLENTSRSPIFSLVAATVQGLGTIHAFGKENEFISKFRKTFDQNSTCMYMATSAIRWLALRVDMLTVVITMITAFLSVALHNQVSPALMGLALAYSASISGVFQYVIRMVAEAETRFISVERITSYVQNLKVEGGSGPRGRPWDGWPQRGTISFNRVCLQYRPNLPSVLNDVSFKVKHAEKLGIVGRTGSGKSSLMTALFRLAELTGGSIEVDQLNIASLDLEQLRSQLTIIPQDPVLFSGTIRTNLDPFGEHKDERLWSALDKTQLRERVTALGRGLDAHVAYGGDNFSVGERQLICLARALLRNTKILVLDEATAAVDPDTEVALHRVIREEFCDSTVLTIAHRVASVLDCDRVLVMENGRVAEMDKPSKLMEHPQSRFYQLVAASKETS